MRSPRVWEYDLLKYLSQLEKKHCEILEIAIYTIIDIIFQTKGVSFIDKTVCLLRSFVKSVVTNHINICSYYNLVALGNFIINSKFLIGMIKFSLLHIILLLMRLLFLKLITDWDTLERAQSYIIRGFKMKFRRN